MKNKILLIFFMFLSVESHSYLVVQDDAFTKGDGLAFRETQTGLVWLDFGVTGEKSFNQVVSELDCTYMGWRLPTFEEVLHLWNVSTFPNGDMGVGISRWAIEYNVDNDTPQHLDFFDVYGATTKYKSNPDLIFYRDSFGLFLNDEGNLGYIEAVEFIYEIQSSGGIAYMHDFYHNGSISTNISKDKVTDWHVMLVKDAVIVDEPSILYLFLISIILVFTKFKKVKQFYLYLCGSNLLRKRYTRSD